MSLDLGVHMLTLGIDFGTSTTAVVVAAPNGAQFVRDAQEHEVLPSMIGWTPNRRAHVGFAAKARLLMDPANTVCSFKRIIGKAWATPAVTRFRQQYPAMVLEADGEGLPRFVTRAGKLTAIEATAAYLAELRQLEPLRGASIANATLSVPVTSEDNERRATTAAAQRAGFQRVALIEEPYAAAIAHFNHVGATSKEEIALVYDLGGGTFDAALVACHGKRLRVLGLSGDAYLGGDDIDTCVTEWAAQRVLEAYHCDVKTSATGHLALMHACERAKIRLSSLDRTTIDLGQIDPALVGKYLELTRAQFEPLFSSLIRRTFMACDDLLARAGITQGKIDALVLSGGSCHIPAIRHGVEHYVGKRAATTIAPDRMCATGTLAHALQGEQFALAPVNQLSA